MITLSLLSLTFSLYANRPVELLIGAPRLSTAAIARAAKTLGSLAKRQDGLFALRLKSGTSSARAESQLRHRGVRVVLPASSEKVQLDSAYSIHEHIRYLEALREVRRTSTAGKGEAEAEDGADYLGSLEWFISQRSGKSGRIDRNMMLQGASHRDQMPDAVWPHSVDQKVGGVFSNVGPHNVTTPYTLYMSAGPVSGRKNGIAFAPSNPNIIYVATAGGGVWKSTNGGVTFLPLSDKWPFLNTSCVAVHPTNPNIVFVGTGDYYGNFSTNSFGLMKSVDGGTTWSNVGDSGMRAGCVTHIIIEPTNPNIMTCSCGKSGNNDSQIHRSTDGGNTWAPVNIMYNNTLVQGNFDSLDRGLNGYYYAAGTLPNTNGGIFRSTDKGATWTTLTSPASDTVEEKAIGLTCSKVNAAIVYLLLTGEQKIYKSTNYGATWTEITGNFPNGPADNPNYNWSQSFYDYHISCAKDGTTDLLFVGLITVAMSRGGGANWVDIGKTFSATPPNNIHADQHSFAMNPAKPNQVLFGCDGGLWRFTLTPGTAGGSWQAINNSFTDFLIDEMAVSPAGDTYLQCGCQDNFSSSARGAVTNWLGLPAGDGCWAGYLPSGQNFVSNQKGGIYLYPSLTSTTYTGIRSQDPKFQTGFFAPYIYAGSTPAIYGGANYLWKYTGTGTNWTNLGTRIAPYDAQQGEFLDVVTELEAAKSNKSIMYSGSMYGEVFLITGNGTAYRQIDDTHIDRVVGAIDTAWANPYDVLVGLMGDRNGNPRLWRCTNTLATTPVWNSVSGAGATALPDVPVNSIERDPYDVSTWYVATDVGCFMTTNAGATWTNMNSLGLPNVLSTAIYVNPSKTSLFVGTFGRGIWKAPLVSTATKFAISGHVGSAALPNVPGVAMALYKWKTSTSTVNTSPHVTIPDGDPNGVLIPITIASSGKISNVSATVSITHQIPNDLEIWLVAPNNNATKLWSSDLPVQPNLSKTFTTTFFNGQSTTGSWRLFVRDNMFDYIVGTVNTFNLSVQYDGYVAAGTATSDALGNYSFPGLEAGLYDLIPRQTSQTFTPSARTLNIGPSQAAVNYTRN
jgi:subtilisin-like proprotein convertase family protein/photosystem II stability/assembly factor-like uncharacterized protein